MSKAISSSKVVATGKRETTNGRVDSPAMKEKIKALAKVLKASDNATLQIGQLCDEIIAIVGICYGGHTFETIANHVEIQCNPRHLRRCWQYFRLVANKDCQSPALDILIKTKPRGVQELARGMDTDMTEEDKAGLVKALASEAVKDNLTVSEIATIVTRELDLRHKLRRNPPKKKKQASNELNSAPNGIPMAVDSETLKQYAECIRAYGKSGKIASIKDQSAVKTVLVAVVDKVEQQAEQVKTDEEYADFLSKQIHRLEQVRWSLLGKNGSNKITQIKNEQQVA